MASCTGRPVSKALEQWQETLTSDMNKKDLWFHDLLEFLYDCVPLYPSVRKLAAFTHFIPSQTRSWGRELRHRGIAVQLHVFSLHSHGLEKVIDHTIFPWRGEGAKIVVVVVVESANFFRYLNEDTVSKQSLLVLTTHVRHLFSKLFKGIWGTIIFHVGLRVSISLNPKVLHWRFYTNLTIRTRTRK